VLPVYETLPTRGQDLALEARVQQTGNATPTTSVNASQLAVVEKYCDAVERGIKKREPDFAFGLPSSSNEHRVQWQKYTSTADLKKASEETTLERQVYVWTEESKIIASHFTLQSESGDWALYPDYCFYKTGTTARMSSELRTFYGSMIVHREWKFDSNGRLLKSTEKFPGLETKKSKNPNDDFIDEEIPPYHKTAELPFLSLLGTLHSRS
jgi:hypothetical protein